MPSLIFMSKKIWEFPVLNPLLSYGLLAGYSLLGLVSFVFLHGYPLPVIHDEFAYLLTADTFIQARLTNPALPVQEFFSSFHVVTSPFYNGKYPPGQGLQLALGHLLGHPLHGVWVTAVIWTCALYWLFKTMLPKTTAFWGVVLFSPFFTFFSYHGQSYWGGTLFALGGTLTLGGVLYCWDKVRVYPAILCGLGLGIMQMTRPLEGLIFCVVPILALTAKHFWKGLPGIRVWFQKFFVPMSFPLFLGLGFHLIYNWANTGHPLQLPYIFYNSSEVMSYGAPKDLFADSLSIFYRTIHAWGGISPLPWSFPVTMAIFSFFVFRNSTTSFWLLPVLVGTIGIVVWSSQPFSRSVWPHYVSAWFGPVGLLAMIGWQRLQEWPSLIMRRLAIVFTVTLLSVFCFHLFKAGIAAELISAKLHKDFHWNLNIFGKHREQLENQLLESYDKSGLTQVVFVSYGPGHNYLEEWIYNRADVLKSAVIWARDLGEQRNIELRALLPQHQAWSLYVERDDEFPLLSPLPMFNGIMDQSDPGNEITGNP
jgi:hypothetical protein